jgi:DNA-directed RNA polymerase specialized sigma24 family protein
VTFDPVSSLERDWRLLVCGPLPARLRAWAVEEPALAPFAGEPARLIAFLRGPATAAAKDELLQALVRAAAEEPLAARVVLEAIAPGLTRLAERIIFDARDRDELWALLLGHAWQQIRRYPLARRPRRIAANLLLETRRAALAEFARERRHGREPPPQQLSSGATSGSGDVEALLGRAVIAGALAEEEAELILRTRIDGISLARLAAEAGLAYHTLNVRRLRAERRLLLFLGRTGVRSGRAPRPRCRHTG